jgi:hypothetical protein
MRERASRWVAVGTLSLLILQVLAGSAMARTTTVDEDTTDNRFAFEYDAGSGEIGSETSSERPSQSDAVYFRVAVLETEDSGSGLLGRLTLRLDGDDHTVYDGWFDLQIESGSGDVAFYRTKPISVHLRPQPGQRRATLRFRFDLPTGEYTAAGSFEARD